MAKPVLISESLRWVLLSLFVGLPFLGLAACSSPAPEELIVSARAPAETLPPNCVRFRDRVIDLEPFLVGFPYSNLQPDLEHGKIFYFEKTPEGTWLLEQDLAAKGRLEFSAGRRVHDVDWSTRTFWGPEYHAPSGRLFVTSDENNDEHTNVYAVDVNSGAVEQITHADYTYGWDFSEDGKLLAYLARKGVTEPFDTALRVLDLESGEDREILRDGGGADRFTWSTLKFSPDQRSIILSIQHDGNRNTKSLARVDLEAPGLDYLMPTREVRYSLGTVDGWVSDTEFLYTSAESGFRNVYLRDLDKGESTRVTDFRDELRSAELIQTKPPSLLVVLGRPDESEILVLDARRGTRLNQKIVPASVRLLEVHGTSGIFSMNSLTSPFSAERVHVFRNSSGCTVGTESFAAIPSLIRQQISHLKVEKVSYPTFDQAADGAQRQLHSFLLTPRSETEDPADRLVFITSFYGGSNRYSTAAQIFGAAGIATFSPAPRGSSGFGAEFAALNDGDLGGDEIVDVLYAARWLQQERSYEPAQIGVRGGSHGGYATMRCLTFPPETNQRNENFNFGFGWSHAGFSDILSFYSSCNIPDWVLKEAGNPETEKAKLRDRSPYYHVGRLNAPLLLTHGENDWRVPVEESRKFVRRAQELDRPVAYVEFSGQGHSIRGFENQVKYYQEVLTFLEKISARP